MNLNQYVLEKVRNLEAFRTWWIKMNEIDPELYPMEFGEDNTGLWNEMFDIFEKKEIFNDNCL